MFFWEGRGRGVFWGWVFFGRFLFGEGVFFERECSFAPYQKVKQRYRSGTEDVGPRASEGVAESRPIQ